MKNEASSDQNPSEKREGVKDGGVKGREVWRNEVQSRQLFSLKPWDLRSSYC